MMGMKGAWVWYRFRLQQQPIRTQMVTSGILWAIGDAIAQSMSRSIEQRLVMKENSTTTIVDENKCLEGTLDHKTNWRRVATASFFGVGFVGPVGHLWYEAFESVCINRLKLKPNSFRFITTKVMADTFLFGHVHLLAFFTYMGLASGKPWDEVKHDVKRDFLPIRHQLLYVNCFCLVDSAYLSWVKHQDNAPWKKYLTSLVSSSRSNTNN
ncbi:hypothetical protein CY35_08G094200 [Sphagnum magellanicum]|nr:hypothetical protein CY35_08G094200 [Sphagnum magellanicum]